MNTKIVKTDIYILQAIIMFILCGEKLPHDVG